MCAACRLRCRLQRVQMGAGRGAGDAEQSSASCHIQTLLVADGDARAGRAHCQTQLRVSRAPVGQRTAVQHTAASTHPTSIHVAPPASTCPPTVRVSPRADLAESPSKEPRGNHVVHVLSSSLDGQPGGTRAVSWNRSTAAPQRLFPDGRVSTCPDEGHSRVKRRAVCPNGLQVALPQQGEW
ncbi:hypothetical protein K505DRAFT_331381 [Melanomma pulvis-pyrius CBS 109.77]|uniref:Uncharacterized protein n=1 Tax=Melanomma pulvis-pyrius CBS 109.77 TaxID=1314802 RepID=A0A6A6XYZ8_9PLEO|nr:hypothetical protein K505DRAFT_331381 [Melanomma pulvis-pyrius CBS 109.77]